MKVLASPRDGEAIDAKKTMYPARLEVVRDRTRHLETDTSTTFGYVVSGRAEVKAGSFGATVPQGGFFALPGEGVVVALGFAVLIERLGFRGMLAFGAIEEKGRLAYIDGCSDSILVMPPRAGDPVLNHLHFPAHVDQSLHAHPSIRLGVVARGEGLAHGSGDWQHRLAPGSVFLLDAHEVHAFWTGPSSMDVVAFHPDSDWGPSDAAHPMRNRTYLLGR